VGGFDRFGRNTLIGGALLLLSLAVAAVGAVVSVKTGNTSCFLVCSIPAAVLIVAGGNMVRKDLLPGADRLLLPGGEQTITAEVLGVTRNLRTAGEKTSYYIVCRYKDPMIGRVETFTSRALENYPGKEVIGRKVTVRIDPREKGKYTVDIDELLEEIEKEKRENEQADGMH
jgi:hypothetical protein